MAPPPPFRNPAGIHPFILNLGSFDQGTVPNTMPNIKASIVAAVFKLDPTFRLRCTTWWFMGQVFDGQNPQSSPVDMEKCSIIYRGFISCIIRGGEGGWNPVRITCYFSTSMRCKHQSIKKSQNTCDSCGKSYASHICFKRTCSCWALLLGVFLSFCTIPTVCRCSRCSRTLHGVLTLGIAHPLIWHLKMQLRNHTTTQW